MVISVTLNNEMPFTAESAEDLKGNVFATVLVNTNAMITSERKASSAQHGFCI